MRSGQSKFQSIIEALLNSAAGYVVAIWSQEVLFPMYGINLPTISHLTLGLWFTLISIIRSLVLRRLFNWWFVIHDKENMEASTNKRILRETQT